MSFGGTLLLLGGNSGQTKALIRRAVAAALKASADVQAVVGLRVYPLAVPEGATLPAIAYQLIGLVRDKNLDGSSGQCEARFDFKVVSKQLSDGEAGAEAIRQCFDSLITTSLTAGDDTIRVSSVTLLSERDLGSDPADGTGRAVNCTLCEYLIQYREPRPR